MRSRGYRHDDEGPLCCPLQQAAAGELAAAQAAAEALRAQLAQAQAAGARREEALNEAMAAQAARADAARTELEAELAQARGEYEQVTCGRLLSRCEITTTCLGCMPSSGVPPLLHLSLQSAVDGTSLQNQGCSPHHLHQDHGMCVPVGQATAWKAGFWSACSLALGCVRGQLCLLLAQMRHARDASQAEAVQVGAQHQAALAETRSQLHALQVRSPARVRHDAHPSARMFLLPALHPCSIAHVLRHASAKILLTEARAVPSSCKRTPSAVLAMSVAQGATSESGENMGQTGCSVPTQDAESRARAELRSERAATEALREERELALRGLADLEAALAARTAEAEAAAQKVHQPSTAFKVHFQCSFLVQKDHPQCWPSMQLQVLLQEPRH